MKTPILILILLSVFSYCSGQDSKVDGTARITIELNPKGYCQNKIEHELFWLIRYHSNRDTSFLLDYNTCMDTVLLPWDININLKSGTSWEIRNPPQKPPFFVPRLLFKSKHHVVIERYNYIEFEGACKTKGAIPWDFLRNITLELEFLSNSGNRCVEIVYEILPDTTGKSHISRIDIND